MEKARWNPRWGREAAGVLFLTTSKPPKLLLALRSGEVLEPGTWGVVGGKVEPGEDPFEAALREAIEELGDIPIDGLMVGSYEYVEPNFKYTTFLVQVPEFPVQDIELNWENDDVWWFAIDELDANDEELHFGLRDLLTNWHKVKLLQE